MTASSPSSTTTYEPGLVHRALRAAISATLRLFPL